MAAPQTGGAISFPDLCDPAGIEVVGNVLRIVFAIDPGGIRWLFAYETTGMLVTASIPFGLVSTGLVLVMFQNLLVEAGLPQPFTLGVKSKVLLATATFSLFSLDLGLAVARSFFGYTSTKAAAATGLLLLVTNLSVAAIFWRQGSKLVRSLECLGAKRTQARRVRWSGFFMVVTSLGQ